MNITFQKISEILFIPDSQRSPYITELVLKQHVDNKKRKTKRKYPRRLNVAGTYRPYRQVATSVLLLRRIEIETYFKLMGSSLNHC